MCLFDNILFCLLFVFHLCCDSFEASAGSNGNAMDSECFGQFLEPFGIPKANWGMYFHGFDRAGNGLVDVRKA